MAARTVKAVVVFRVDDERVVAEIDGPPLARATLAKALDEFWRVDAESYSHANREKWLRLKRRQGR